MKTELEKKDEEIKNLKRKIKRWEDHEIKVASCCLNFERALKEIAYTDLPYADDCKNSNSCPICVAKEALEKNDEYKLPEIEIADEPGSNGGFSVTIRKGSVEKSFFICAYDDASVKDLTEVFEVLGYTATYVDGDK